MAAGIPRFPIQCAELMQISKRGKQIRPRMFMLNSRGLRKILSPILWVAIWISGLIGVVAVYPQQSPQRAHLPDPKSFLTKIPGLKAITSLADPTTPATPVPSLTFTSLTPFLYEVGADAPASQTINVGTSSGANIAFAATQSDDSWLNLQQTATTTPGQVVVSIAPSGLDVGQYQGEIALTSDQADNSPQTTRVQLTVNPGSISVSPSNLQFTYLQGSAAPPASQSIAVMGSFPTTYTATASSDGNWISLTNASGPTPANLAISINPINLGPGKYKGKISILGATSSSPVTIGVDLNVSPARAPSLFVSPSSLSVSLVQGSPVSMQQLIVSNGGSGILTYSANVVPVSGGKWLSLPQSSGTASAIAPSALQLAIDPGGLMPGTYSSVVNISSPNAGLPFSANVILTISASTQSMLLSQAGLQFTGVHNGQTPLPQSFGILNSGQGSMLWNAAGSTLSDGPAWLTVDRTAGSSRGSSLDSQLVKVSVNQAGLAPGTYYGSVQVSAPDADHSQQNVSVRLDVLPSFQSPGATLSSSGLILTGIAGDRGPQARVFTLFNPSARAANFTSISSTNEGGEWFKQSPSSGLLPPGGSVEITVQPNFAGLTSGIRKGLIDLTLGDGMIRAIRVVSIVSDGATCQPSTSAVQITSPEPNFVATVGKSVPVTARIIDNCGNALDDSSRTFALATMPDSRILSLVPQGGGLWTGTWSPSSPADVTAISVSSGTLFSESTVPSVAITEETGTVQKAVVRRAISKH